jgi:WD40 repeat protein
VTNQRSYSCLAFSSDGKYLAAGEGAFRQPEITIWEIDQSGEYIESKHLKGHKYGIESVMFSPNLLYLISLGDANDRGLFVWDWRTEQRVTSNKLGKPVNTFAYAKSSTFFVTAGFQHLKYWYFDEDGRVQKNAAQGAAAAESIMESKSADLTKVKLKIFVGVQCVNNGGVSGKEEQVLSLASDGHLYVYDKNRKLTKWMNIKVDRALGCALGGDLLYCGCTEGIVRIFNSKSLEHILTLPKPPPLGQANVESGKKIRIPPNKDSRFADAIAVLVDEQN